MAARFPPDAIVREWRGEILAFLGKCLSAAQGAPGELYPTSWWRDAVANWDAGGDEYSQHLLALALDIGGSAEGLSSILQSARAEGLIAVDERATEGIVHVQLYPAGFLEGLLRSQGMR